MKWEGITERINVRGRCEVNYKQIGKKEAREELNENLKWKKITVKFKQKERR